VENHGFLPQKAPLILFGKSKRNYETREWRTSNPRAVEHRNPELMLVGLLRWYLRAEFQDQWRLSCRMQQTRGRLRDG
jgi:hypothetical protein